MRYFNILYGIKTTIINTLYKIKYKKRYENNEEKDEYFERLEREFDEFKAFKHDYNNILTTISGYIEDDDMKGLEDYFYKKIVKIHDFETFKLSKLGTLGKLKIPEVRGMILMKIIQAEKRGVKASISILDEISDLKYIDKILFSRCLGIIIDNAIEAAEECDNSFIKIAFIIDNNNIRCIVENNHREIDFDFKKIHEKGSSTKGEGRGLGLHTVKQLLAYEDRILLDSIVRKDIFIQELSINRYYEGGQLPC